MLTEQEIWDKLILEYNYSDPRVWRIQTIHRNTSTPRLIAFGPERAEMELYKGTGRTTQMAVKVLSVMSLGQAVYPCSPLGVTPTLLFQETIKYLAQLVGADIEGKLIAEPSDSWHNVITVEDHT